MIKNIGKSDVNDKVSFVIVALYHCIMFVIKDDRKSNP